MSGVNLRVKVHQTTISFDQNGADVVVIVKSTNKDVVQEIEDLMRFKVKRDAGIVCVDKSKYIDIDTELS